MQIHHNIDNFISGGTIITIGTFDGVHLGHQKVLDRILNISRDKGLESVVFTFYPHPRFVVGKVDEGLRLLNTLDEKIERLKLTGIDHLVVYPFTAEFANQPYDEFVKTILINKLNMKSLVVGYDHRLGRNREGNYENLLAMSEKMGFSLHQIEQLSVEQADISSSKIRRALQKGNIETANRFLGYEYQLKGMVSGGKQIGRTIGYPTANIETSDPYKLIPQKGVYAVRVTIAGKTYPGMLNIGYRPTIATQADCRTIEVHILNFNEDIYNMNVSMSFISRIRDEIKFDSIEALKQQLNKDKDTVLSIF